MSALRCSICGIDYPNHFLHQKCKVCGEATNGFTNLEPNADWQRRVAIAEKALAESVETPKADKVELWREEQLLAAGFSGGSAAELAADRCLDLHKAVELAQRAGPELAYRILT